MDLDPRKARYEVLTKGAQGLVEKMVDDVKDEPEVSRNLLTDLDKRIEELQNTRRRLVAAST